MALSYYGNPWMACWLLQLLLKSLYAFGWVWRKDPPFGVIACICFLNFLLFLYKAPAQESQAFFKAIQSLASYLTVLLIRYTIPPIVHRGCFAALQRG